MTPFGTLRAVTTARPISFTSAEILQYLGGLNLGYAVLALQGLLLPKRETVSRKRAALILSIVSLLFLVTGASPQHAFPLSHCSLG